MHGPSGRNLCAYGTLPAKIQALSEFRHLQGSAAAKEFCASQRCLELRFTCLGCFVDPILSVDKPRQKLLGNDNVLVGAEDWAVWQ